MKNLSKKETLLGMMYSGRDCELKHFCNVSINITYQTIKNDIDYLKGLPVHALNEGTPTQRSDQYTDYLLRIETEVMIMYCYPVKVKEKSVCHEK